MRVRLFKLGQRARLLTLGLGAPSLLALGTSCGPAFTANGSSSAGAGGGKAGANSAGSSGEMSHEAGAGGNAEGGSSGDESGSGGDMPSAGGGGKPTVGCDCTVGEYCQDGTTKCRKCADFSRLEFGTAQKLGTLALSIERFPRSAGIGSQLFYVSGAPDQARILYTAAPVSGAGVTLTPPTQVESGPLYVNGYAEQNLFFDRQQPDGRKLMMATWTAPDLRTADALVPAPINASGFDDYSIAISPNTGHVYWMSTRNGAPELLWQPTSLSAPPAPAPLDLKLKVGSAECARSGDDATPWVNLAGTLLLFSNPSLNDSCEPNDSGASDLYAAPLNKEGTAAGSAIALGSLNVTGGTSRETDPSLSPDSCAIYFASDNGTRNFDLYRAPRN